MKKTIAVCLSLAICGAPGWIKAQGNTKYIAEKHTDPSGYVYETVTNDPTGLRLYTLKNGMKVYLAQNFDEPRIRSMMVIGSGSTSDPADNTGLAHYLEHLLFNGTDSIGTLDWKKEKPLLDEIAALFEKHKAEKDPERKKIIYHRIDSLSYEASKYAVSGEYRRMASSIGAVAINGFTNYDITAYWCLIPSPSLEKHLQMESERFSNIALRSFHTELEIVYEEYNTMQDNTARQKRDRLNALLFKKHPYGQQSLIGLSEHLKNPSLQAIRSYFDRFYVPDNMAAILVGDLDFDKTIKLVDKAYGGFQRKTLKRPVLPKEDEQLQPEEQSIYGPGEESVNIGFRMGGAGTKDARYAQVVDLMLNNGFAGLFDIELNTGQKVKSAGTSVDVKNDYAVHYFDGYPKEGQSLEDVRDQMLAQLERIKKGEFDDWLLQGAVNELKKEEAQRYSTAVNLSAAYFETFARKEDWKNRLAYYDELGKITKQEIVDFARKAYGTNYAVLFKRKGEAPPRVKVEKPQITPIRLNSDSSSAYAAKFAKIACEQPKPVFVDFEKAIRKSVTANGVDVSFVENKKNRLFEMDILFDMGQNNSKKLALAVDFLNRIGTAKYPVGQLKNEFYKEGLTFFASADDDQTTLHLEGLEENLERGIELLDELLSGATADSTACNAYIAGILNERKNKSDDMDAVFSQGLVSYALYGEHSSLRYTLSAAELKATRADELTGLVKDLRNYRHRIFYYGSNFENLLGLLNAHYTAQPVKTCPAAEVFTKQKTKQEIYFVHTGKVQAKLMLISRGELFDVANYGASNFFSPYADHVLFKEVREARSLAYLTAAAHILNSEKVGYDYTYLYAGVQSDKLPEAIGTMLSMMQKLPGTAADLQYVKEDQLKRFAAERITGTDIFRTYERLRRRGITRDIREDMYRYTQQVTPERLQEFFRANIAGRETAILIAGDREKIDWKALAGYGEVKELEVKYLFNY